MRHSSLLLAAFVTAAVACDRGVNVAAARGSVAIAPRILINEVMANPRAAADERGEWFELLNLESSPIDIGGWSIVSENDVGTVIARSVVVPANGFVLLARDGDRRTNGGVEAGYEYGSRVALGNGADWLALRTRDGHTVDSVSWTSAVSGASRARTVTDPAGPDVGGDGWATSTTRFGSGDRGTPGAANDVVASAVTGSDNRPQPPWEAPPRSRDSAMRAGRGAPRFGADPARDSTLTVRVLDVGQGDAILVENGGSRVLIDGGPDGARLGQLLERLGLGDSAIDAVILTHQHHDHYSGLRELFRTRRRIGIRYFFENRDPAANMTLAELRDSIGVRAQGGALEYRDTDDPCGTGAASCTITMRGGARLHVLRPDPRGDGPNNRSAAVKLVAPDSASFVMWLVGDAEQQENRWFDASDYDSSPGMRSHVLKANHHGSCDGVSRRYLDLVRPELVVISLAGVNDYGYVHSQTLDLLGSRRIPWYRTDQNGTITITVPARPNVGGRGYSVAVERGRPNMRGPSDRRARECGEQ